MTRYKPKRVAHIAIIYWNTIKILLCLTVVILYSNIMNVEFIQLRKSDV
jgi:hypothetical protein